MQNQFSRTQLLIGKPAMDTLMGSRVAVFGLGGVGSYVVEVLARSGVGELDIFDDDRVCLTNVNRQLYAVLSTVGKHKVDVAEARIHDINRQCIVHKYQMFYLPQNADSIDLSLYDYVVDCIDTVSAKIELIKRCHQLNIPMISSMGAANKLDATAFRVTDINKTKMDPLAKVILGVSESANSVFVPLRSSMQKYFTGPAAFAPKGMSKHPNRNNLIRLLFIVD